MSEKEFKRDLSNLLHILEHLCQGHADHVDYVKAYKYFINTWAPKNEEINEP
jgi:hypothetical protein